MPGGQTGVVNIVLCLWAIDRAKARSVSGRADVMRIEPELEAGRGLAGAVAICGQDQARRR
jgi:hypothetical protein